MGYFILISIAVLIYLIIGLVLAVRVHSLAECEEHEQGPLDPGEFWMIIFLWVTGAFIIIWRKGVNDA